MEASDRARPRAEALAPVEDVRALVLSSVAPLPPRQVPLAEAGGLVLAEPVVAPFDLPPFPNAAMDGFAVRSADTAPAPAALRLVGEALAGRPFGGRVGPGEAVAVATGAVLPEGADAVVPLEEASVQGERVVVGQPVPPGRHVRGRGEDVRAGEVLLPAGTVLGPGQVAAAAATGREAVAVHPRPRAAVVPTGDEVVPAGRTPGPGQVHDAVSPALAVLVGEVGAVPLLRPVAPDDPGRLLDALEEAAARSDVLVTVGGASRGERDLVSRLEAGEAGRVVSFRVALRPAKPFAFGRAFGVPLFGLPGNPASALAAFEELVRPALLAMMGRRPATRPSVRAFLAEDFEQRPGRLHLVRAEAWREGGRLLVRPAGRQGAGMVHSLARANAWMVVGPEVTSLPAGAEVEVRLLTDPP
ncbi:MAG TPA: gephyrin-like molybdotransferase Glp [Actinomycetota bacterium]|nr:gephyrin-like molybdotransferase Glp [Actinomycetota bacterium]